MLRKYLEEHVVVNVADVDRFAEPFAGRVRSPEAKAWFSKRLRQRIMNDENLLRPIDPSTETDLPPYAEKALTSGERVYRYDGELQAVSAFRERINHLVDFFQSIETFASADVNHENAMVANQQLMARRWLSKINKMTVDQVEGAAEEWFQYGAKNQLGGKKEGVDVIHVWPDGYYAVSFTSKETMMKDGNDLQNCLRHGYYWDDVASGSQKVIAIRKPNDEAVVGMRWRGAAVLECKGKNNQTVSDAYVGYVASLLTLKGIKKSSTEDITSAGLTYNNGRWGTFYDLATKSVRNGVEIWFTEDKLIARRGDLSLTIPGTHHLAHNLDQAGELLTAVYQEYPSLKLKLDQIANRLNIHFGENRYGTFDQVAKNYEVGDFIYRIASGITKVIANGAPIFKLTHESGKLLSTSLIDNAYDDRNSFVDVLNRYPGGIEGHPALYVYGSIMYRDGKWGSVLDLGIEVFPGDDSIRAIRKGNDGRTYFLDAAGDVDEVGCEWIAGIFKHGDFSPETLNALGVLADRRTAHQNGVVIHEGKLRRFEEVGEKCPKDILIDKDVYLYRYSAKEYVVSIPYSGSYVEVNNNNVGERNSESLAHYTATVLKAKYAPYLIGKKYYHSIDEMLDVAVQSSKINERYDIIGAVGYNPYFRKMSDEDMIKWAKRLDPTVPDKINKLIYLDKIADTQLSLRLDYSWKTIWRQGLEEIESRVRTRVTELLATKKKYFIHSTMDGWMSVIIEDILLKHNREAMELFSKKKDISSRYAVLNMDKKLKGR